MDRYDEGLHLIIALKCINNIGRWLDDYGYLTGDLRLEYCMCLEAPDQTCMPEFD